MSINGRMLAFVLSIGYVSSRSIIWSNKCQFIFYCPVDIRSFSLQEQSRFNLGQLELIALVFSLCALAYPGLVQRYMAVQL